MLRRAGTIFLMAALAFLAAACDAESGPPALTFDEPRAPSPLVEGYVQVSDQTTDGNVVEVFAAEINGAPGVLAVWTSGDDEPGRVVGHEFISEGLSSRVDISLSEPVSSGTYWVVLHRDGDTELVFEFPGPDAPVAEGERIVQERFRLDVGETTPRS